MSAPEIQPQAFMESEPSFSRALHILYFMYVHTFRPCFEALSCLLIADSSTQ
jgi:hypothetical protein